MKSVSLRRLVPIAATACALGLAACGGTTSSGAKPPETIVIASDGTARVLLRSLRFEPKTFTVPVGTTLKFVWKERIAHNIVFEDKVRSGIQIEGSYSRAMDTAGVYKFQCTLHPGMKGTVTVSP